MRNHADGVVDWHSVERVLILKVSSMGDVVHASPVASALKRAYPHLHVGWVAEDRHGGVLVGSPRIDRLHILPHALLRKGLLSRAMWRAFWSAAREIRAERYQVAIDLQGLTKSAMWGVLGRVPLRFGGHRMRELTPLLLRRIPIEDRPDRHVVQQYLDALRWLGVPCEFPDLYRTPDDAKLPEPPVEFPLAVAPNAEALVAQKLQVIGAGDAPLITLNPSAGREWKRWALEKFAELSDRIETELGIPAVFLGGKGDLPLAEQLQTLKRKPLRSLIGQTSLEELKAVIRRSAVHICGDTGSAHLASAFSVPCVSLYGPTLPDRTGPYGQRHRAIVKRHLCRQCPPNQCLRRECLQWITVEEVFEAICNVLGELSSRSVPTSP